MKRILTAVTAAVLLCACQNVELMMNARTLDKASRDYNVKMRWQQMDVACMSYMDAALLEECSRRVEAARDVKVSEYRVRSLVFDRDRGTARVVVEFDFYVPPAVTLKTVVDRQEWALVGEKDDAKVWKLKTLPPEFR
jgi:hypothetical protein